MLSTCAPASDARAAFQDEDLFGHGLTSTAFASGIVVPVALCAGGSGVIDGMAIGAGGAMMIKAVYPAARVGMDKVRIPIAGGMALDTIGTELADMRGWLGVAGSAIPRGIVEDVIRMAAGAGHANMRAGQQEGGGVAKIRMRKMGRIDEGQRGICTAVIRVTGPARTAHSARQQRSVQGLRIKLLGGNVGMAFHTQGGHPGRIPERRMAG
jgi:hypothetical protein